MAVLGTGTPLYQVGSMMAQFLLHHYHHHRHYPSLPMATACRLRTCSGIAAGPANRPFLAPGASDRSTQPRSNFTRFVRSGGNDRASLWEVAIRYVSSSSGGSRTAMRRMGSSRRALNNFANLSHVQQQGAHTALKQLDLDSLAGKGIDEVFAGLIDYICPDGGNVDEGIARSAFIERLSLILLNWDLQISMR